jgi:hypothetical protein
MKELSIDSRILQEIKKEEPEIRRIKNEAMRRKGFKDLDSAAGLNENDPSWLWTLKIKGKEALNEKSIAQSFIHEAQSDPASWLLPKAVEALQLPLLDADVNAKITKPQRLLLELWLAKSGVPRFYWLSFCYYNDKAIAKMLGFILNYQKGHFNEKSVRKIWERLGLKKSRRLLFRDVEFRRGEAFPVIFKKLIQRPV